MINYIVDDLDAMIERLQKEGVKIAPERMDESYGRFAWIYESRRQQDRAVGAAENEVLTVGL